MSSQNYVNLFLSWFLAVQL